MARDGEPLVIELPRTPGRKDAEYMHLFSGAVDVEAHICQAQAASASASSPRVSVADLSERVDRLESDVAELKKLLQ